MIPANRLTLGARAARLSLALFLVPLTTASLPASAAEIVEQGSGQRFTTPLLLSGNSYSLLGVGLRSHQNGQGGKLPKVSDYAMALYVDHAAARIPFPSLYGKAPTRAMMMAESRAQNFILWGRFGKLGVLRFLHPYTKADIATELHDGMADLFAPKASDEMHKDADKFIALFDKDFKEGDEVRIQTDETGRIEVQIDGIKRPGPHNPKLARHIWEIWLGSHAISKEMRASLVDRLDILKK
jgi:hypothetical protein